MSERSYIAGFCKAASAHNVDPKLLARYAVEKEAQDAAAGSSLYNKIMAKLTEYGAAAKKKSDDALAWYVNADPTVKALIGAGLGSAAGTGIGAALAGKKGLRSGAILGALGGGAAAMDWKAISEALSKMKKDKGAGAQQPG